MKMSLIWTFDLGMSQWHTSTSKESLIKNSIIKFLQLSNLFSKLSVIVKRILSLWVKLSEFLKKILHQKNINTKLLVFGKHRQIKVQKNSREHLNRLKLLMTPKGHLIKTCFSKLSSYRKKSLIGSKKWGKIFVKLKKKCSLWWKGIMLKFKRLNNSMKKLQPISKIYKKCWNKTCKESII